MKKVISFKMVQKCTSILSFVLFFVLLSFNSSAQSNYLPSDQALDKLKQNADALTILISNANQGTQAYFLLDTKLSFNEETSKALNNGSTVEDAIHSGSQVVLASLTRTPQLSTVEQRDIIQLFVALLSR